MLAKYKRYLQYLVRIGHYRLSNRPISKIVSTENKSRFHLIFR